MNGCPQVTGRPRPSGRVHRLARTARRRRSTASATSGSPTPTAPSEIAGDERRQRAAPHQVRHRAAGSMAKNWARPRRSGGRPTARRLRYYRFDESQVNGLLSADGADGFQSAMDVEAYPKAGAPNPIAEVFVYDVARARPTTRRARRQAVRQHVIGHYVYDVRWSPDGTEAADEPHEPPPAIMEFVACRPSRRSAALSCTRSGRPAGSRTVRRCDWLEDSKRFIWESERNGWTNYYLYDFTGKLINPSRSTRVRSRRPSSRSMKRRA